MGWEEVLMRYCKETADVRDPSGEQLPKTSPDQQLFKETMST